MGQLFTVSIQVFDLRFLPKHREIVLALFDIWKAYIGYPGDVMWLDWKQGKECSASWENAWESIDDSLTHTESLYIYSRNNGQGIVSLDEFSQALGQKWNVVWSVSLPYADMLSSPLERTGSLILQTQKFALQFGNCFVAAGDELEVSLGDQNIEQTIFDCSDLSLTEWLVISPIYQDVIPQVQFVRIAETEEGILLRRTAQVSDFTIQRDAISAAFLIA